MRKFRIGSKIMLIIIACSMLTACLIGGISLYQGVTIIKREANEELKYISSSYANEFSQELAEAEGIVNSLAAAVTTEFDLAAFESEPNYIASKMDIYKQLVKNFAYSSNEFLSTFISFDPSMTEVLYTVWYTDIYGEGTPILMTSEIKEEFVTRRYVQMEDGEYYIPSQDMKRESPEAQYLFRTLEEGRPIWFTPYKEIWFEFLLISYITPITVDNKIVGVAGMDVSFEHIKNTIAEMKIYDSGFAVLLDAHGEIIMYPDGTLAEEDLEPFSKAVKAHKTDKNTTFEYKSNRMDGLIGFATLSNDWTLCVFVPNRELLAPMYDLALSIVTLTFFVIVIVIVVSYLSSRKVSRVIDEATEQLRYIEIGDFTKEFPKELLESNDDLGHFIKSVNTMQGVIRDLMDEIRMSGGRLLVNPLVISTVFQETGAAKEKALSAIQQLSMEKKEHQENLEDALKQLETMNNSLQSMVSEELQRSRQKDAIVIYQSRLANMGEMIGNIAHQWKQSLNGLNVILGELKDARDYGELNNESFNNAIKSAARMISGMSQTIEDFMNYLRPSYQKSVFSVANSLDFALDISGHSMRVLGIYPEVKIEGNASVYGFENEFTQVLCNILDNAKDASLEPATGKKIISIAVTEKDGEVRIAVFNNGKQITPEVMEKIFIPFYTTKPLGKGSGIGLYMAKVIVEEHMQGKIWMENVPGGVRCCILLPTVEAGDHTPLKESR